MKKNQVIYLIKSLKRKTFTLSFLLLSTLFILCMSSCFSTDEEKKKIYLEELIENYNNAVCIANNYSEKMEKYTVDYESAIEYYEALCVIIQCYNEPRLNLNNYLTTSTYKRYITLTTNFTKEEFASDESIYYAKHRSLYNRAILNRLTQKDYEDSVSRDIELKKHLKKYSNVFIIKKFERLLPIKT